MSLSALALLLSPPFPYRTAHRLSLFRFLAYVDNPPTPCTYPRDSSGQKEESSHSTPMDLDESLALAVNLGREEDNEMEKEESAANRRRRYAEARQAFLDGIREDETVRKLKPIADSNIDKAVANGVLDGILPGLLDDDAGAGANGKSQKEDDFTRTMKKSYRNLFGVSASRGPEKDIEEGGREKDEMEDSTRGGHDQSAQIKAKIHNPRHVRLGSAGTSSASRRAKKSGRESKERRAQIAQEEHRNWRRRQREEALKRKKAELAVKNEQLFLRRMKIENDATKRARELRKGKAQGKKNTKGKESSNALNRKKMNQRLEKENRKIAERLRKLGPKRKNNSSKRSKRSVSNAKASPSTHPTAPTEGEGLKGGGAASQSNNKKARERYLSAQPLLDEVRDLRRAITTLEDQNKLDAARLRRAEGRAKRVVNFLSFKFLVSPHNSLTNPTRRVRLQGGAPLVKQLRRAQAHAASESLQNARELGREIEAAKATVMGATIGGGSGTFAAVSAKRQK